MELLLGGWKNDFGWNSAGLFNERLIVGPVPAEKLEDCGFGAFETEFPAFPDPSPAPSFSELLPTVSAKPGTIRNFCPEGRELADTCRKQDRIDSEIGMIID